jgi:ADP-ribose pyrophosphatase
MSDDTRLRIHGCERVLDGWIAVDDLELSHRRFDGGWTRALDRRIVRRGEAVVVLPYDAARDRVVFIEQFRAGAIADARSPWLVEIVAGLRDKGGSPEETARRELAEEAGLDAGELLQVWEGYATPGFADEYLYGFIAQVDAGAVDGHHGLEEEDEDIRPFSLAFDEALDWWRRAEIRNLPAITTLLALAAERPRLRARWRG